MQTSPPLRPIPRIAPSGELASISSGGTRRRASRVQYVMPWYSVRQVGQTIALDVATARPPPPPPRTTAGRGRGRGAAGGDGATGAGAGGSGGGALCVRVRRRSTSAIATRPTITSASRPITATSSGSALAAMTDELNPDIDPIACL